MMDVTTGPEYAKAQVGPVCTETRRGCGWVIVEG